MPTNQSYEGGAFHSSFPRGRASGTIRITPDGLLFRNDRSEFRLPLDKLTIKRGGAADRLIFFTHPGVDDLSIFTSETGIVDDPALQTRTHLRQQVQSLKSHRNRARLVTVSILIAIAAVLAGLVALKEPLVMAVTNRIPYSWEEKLGNTIYQQMIVGKTVINDPAITSQLERITDPLVAAVASKHYKFRFHIVDDSLVNAFAVPGGNVVINRGLILEASTPEEVAGVLAHEIAHVTCRHSMRQVVGAAGVYLIVQAMLGDMTGLLAVIAENGTFLLTRKFSRDFETEADNVGWKTLLKARIDPRGMISFFKTLKSLEEETSSIGQTVNDSLNFLSTHPGTDDRIKYLEERFAKLSKNIEFMTLDVDFEKLKADIHTALGNSDNETSPENDNEN